MDAEAGRGRKEGSPWVSTRFSVGVENEQADAGQDNRIYMFRETAESNSRAAEGKGTDQLRHGILPSFSNCNFPNNNNVIFPFQLTTRRIGNHSG